MNLRDRAKGHKEETSLEDIKRMLPELRQKSRQVYLKQREQ